MNWRGPATTNWSVASILTRRPFATKPTFFSCALGHAQVNHFTLEMVTSQGVASATGRVTILNSISVPLTPSGKKPPRLVPGVELINAMANTSPGGRPNVRPALGSAEIIRLTMSLRSGQAVGSRCTA